MVPALLLAAALLPGDPPATPGPDSAALMRASTAVTKETAEVLAGVTDRATAERAKPKLAELHDRYMELEKRLSARPDEERYATEAKVVADRKKQDEALALAHDKVFARHKDAYKSLAETGVFKRVEGAHEREAMLRMQKIEQGCKNYYVVNDEKWPASLRDLSEKRGGKPPLLEGGLKAVTDPWGAPFRFEVVTDASGSERVRVWTLSPYGDGKKELVWPATLKK